MLVILKISMIIKTFLCVKAVADPGFPVGGAPAS